MHIGGVTIFEGPPPSYEDLLDHVESRLHLVPRYRQKLAIPPVETGRPFWVDDPQFNLDYHVRHSALPAPGDEDAAARGWRPASSPSSSTGPSRSGSCGWSRGCASAASPDLEDPPRAGRRGLGRRHRDRALRRQAGARARQARSRVDPEPEPVGGELAARGIEGVAKAPIGLARRVASAVASPRRRRTADPGGRRGRRRGRLGAREPGARRCRSTSPIGPHRRYTWVRGDLADFKKIKAELGGTVNDVVLCAVAGALRHWLHDARRAHRGARAAGPGSGLDPGDRRARPARQPDRRRARAAAGLRRGPGRAAADGARGDGRGQVVEAGARRRGDLAFNDFAPPTLLAQASRINFSTRLFNLIVTNVPGPQIPLYVLGRELAGHLPGRVPAREPRAGDRDHVLQRQDRLRPARRLRRDGGRDW